MSKILFLIFLLFIKENKSDEKIEPNISKTIYLDYLKPTNFIFDISGNNILQINIRTINCKIEIEPAERIKGNDYFEFYYLLLNSKNNTISIIPSKDKIDGLYKENYEIKKCPLIINSYYISGETQQLYINNKEENYFYFDTSIYSDIFHISYNIAKVSNNSFTSLYFRFEDTPLNIDISYTNNNSKNSLFKKIAQSTFIYLDNEFLSYNNNDYSGGILKINITNVDKRNTSMFFKVIEDNNICLLDKNGLNFGFITSKSTYQYYYAEILPGEEGELMLHNKRLYGKLHAKIIEKKDTNNINNISIYPNGDNNEGILEYNEHKLQLKFSFLDTLHCKNGCYILITYEQIKSKEDFPLIGYEYTILSSTWNFTDSESKLINIPPNEYIIGCFEKGTSPEHYYSIHIPNNTENVILQYEGSYFEVYYEGGRKKINTWYIEYEKLNIDTNKNMTVLNKSQYNNSDYLSFKFNYIDIFTISSSYYYFRVLFIKKK